ncbi:hypothetical protein MRX96_031919 [Rhipicephalus microplus]
MLVSVVVTEDLSVSVYFKCAPLVSDDVCIPDEVRDVRVLDNLLDSVERYCEKKARQQEDKQPTTARTSRAAPAATPTGRPPAPLPGQQSPTDNDPSIVAELELDDFNETVTQRGQHDIEHNAGLSNTTGTATNTFLPPSRRPTGTP